MSEDHHETSASWPRVPLKVLAEVNPESLSSRTPRDLRFQYIDISSVEEGRLHWSEVRNLVYADAPSRARRIVQPDDVLFGTVRPYLQSHGFVDQDQGLLVASTGFAVLRALDDEAEPGFIYHWVMSQDALDQSRQREVGSNYPAVNESEVAEFTLPKPPLPEQRRIAEILDTVDEAIRKTEEVLAKLEQIKKGLLHDLLTRGIDENGELRDPQRHPEVFKDSELGRIPRGWGVKTVEQLLADVDPSMRSGPFGSSLRKSDLVPKGVPLLGIDNVHVERFVADFTRFVSPEKAIDLSRYKVRPQDVRITIMGTVGRCCLVPSDIGEALSSKHVWTLTFDQERYSPYLAALQFNYSRWVLAHFSKDEQGGIMSAIRSKTLRTALLPVPPRAEQQRIELVLRAAQSRLDAELQSAEKMALLKKGLMDDLFTGRMRVLVEAEEPV